MGREKKSSLYRKWNASCPRINFRYQKRNEIETEARKQGICLSDYMHNLLAKRHELAAAGLKIPHLSELKREATQLGVELEFYLDRIIADRNRARTRLKARALRSGAEA